MRPSVVGVHLRRGVRMPNREGPCSMNVEIIRIEFSGIFLRGPTRERTGMMLMMLDHDEWGLIVK